MATKLKELDLAALRFDLPEHGLIAGDVGTVVLVHGDSEAFEIEFVAADGATLGVVTLLAQNVFPVDGRRILHVEI